MKVDKWEKWMAVTNGLIASGVWVTFFWIAAH